MSSDNNSSSDSNNNVNHSKKRKRDPRNWKRNSDKLKRLRGELYVSISGKVVPARETGPACNCRRKCVDILDEEEKQEIITKFNSLSSKEAQDAFLCASIAPRPVQRRRPRKGDESGVRNFSYAYKVCIKYL